MTVMSSSMDAEALTLTFVTEFEAPIGSVWRLWSEPRRLEQWWGPPTWPATFAEYDFRVGGKAHYVMTGPDGDEAHGLWRIVTIDEPTRFAFEDAFASATGEIEPSLGIIRMEVTLEDLGERTRMTVVSRFESTEQFEQVAGMGMEEGMRSALEQIDGVLAA